MDHWGDPWADDADSKSPTKQEVATPPSTAYAPAPVVLNGFLDDAQWGSFEDEGAGAWATTPRKAEHEVAAPVTRVLDGSGSESWGGELLADTSGVPKKTEDNVESNEWALLEDRQDSPKELENGVSETSDSATTVQADEAHGRGSTELPESLHSTDDISTRTSTSPSDASHNEVVNESPRTSFEDERIAGKTPLSHQNRVHKDDAEPVKKSDGVSTTVEVAGSESADDDFGDFEEHVQEPNEAVFETESVKQVPETSCGTTNEDEANFATRSESRPSSLIVPTSIELPAIDYNLMTELFPPSKNIEEPEEAPDDPVHSTSTRKAWYRLTRKQTMREYNSGGTDENYIRITWARSHIRSEVNKIVSKWAMEDRMAGRGPGARASFYWDTPADAKLPPLHARKKSSISVSNPIRPATQNTPSVSTNVPAAFNWSSPSATNDPWKQDNASMRSTSSPTTARHSAIAKVQRQEGRAVSVDLGSHSIEPMSHKRTATESAVPKEASPPVPIVANTPAEVDPWVSLGSLDTSPPLDSIAASNAEEDDDWGEMVESPVLSTTAPTTEFHRPSTSNYTPSTPATTPKSARASPVQPHTSKHASPIVRLKGTVSPTTAIFKYNSFVPAGTEDGPIGPGVLKSTNRSTSSTPEKPRSATALRVKRDEPPNDKVEQAETQEVASNDFSDFASSTPEPPQLTAEDDFSALESSTAQPAPAQPSSAPPPAPQSSTDTWADADFSIFESSVPPTTSVPSSRPPTDPSDPWSIFENPAAPTATSTPTPPVPFTRPPPREVTPPPKQPLTGATNSLQRRKAEEDAIIQGIIDELPDLSYMLRR